MYSASNFFHVFIVIFWVSSAFAGGVFLFFLYIVPLYIITTNI
nr:MAG TPA: hypothetical protein [Caudoviricetes sp.]